MNELAIERVHELLEKADKGEILIKAFDVKVDWSEIGKLSDYKDILKLVGGKHCCWVHEDKGYFAYCHEDGRLITRTGHGSEVNVFRTWSSVGYEMLAKSGISGIKL